MIVARHIQNIRSNIVQTPATEIGGRFDSDTGIHIDWIYANRQPDIAYLVRPEQFKIRALPQMFRKDLLYSFNFMLLFFCVKHFRVLLDKNFGAYNTLLSSQGKESTISELSDTECVLVKYRPDPENKDVGAVYRLNIGNGGTTDVTVVQTTLNNPIGFANSVATLLVSDRLYQTIASGQPEQITVVSINGGTTRSDGTAYTILKGAMPENIYLTSAWQRQTEIVQLNSSTYLLIAFATIIFLIATGSILYFQNLSAVSYDRDDYNILQRMGYSRDTIKRCVRRQIQIYFVIPYVMGMLHSIFAIVCYKSALMDDVLGQAGEVILPIALAIGIFSIIYFIYYQITKYSCYKAAIN